jgi:hypothetical protein
MYRDEYIAKCVKIAEKFASGLGLRAIERSVKDYAGYGRIIRGKWEIEGFEIACYRYDKSAYYCRIDAMIYPWLDSKCFSCKCVVPKTGNVLFTCERCKMEAEKSRERCKMEAEKSRERCKMEAEKSRKTRARISRDEREAKEIRSLTRQLERCIREKVKRTASIPHQNDGAY